MDKRIITQNKKARHEYHIIDTTEAGIVLRGTEVKSIREGKVNLSDSYASIENGEVFIINLHISPYEKANVFNHDPLRKRKLLLRRHEIRKLQGKVIERGFTLIPLSLYLRDNRWAKLELALVKGKKLYDRREDVKRRDYKREVERQWKDRY
jgi:SsrA-binding protein